MGVDRRAGHQRLGRGGRGGLRPGFPTRLRRPGEGIAVTRSRAFAALAAWTKILNSAIPSTVSG
ncbi:MAG: hypothetical protein MZU95_06805 [Desulfomicrobium escambiense]|nr:hypothetical protein [Desulfomicrobium escambiense]